MKFSYLVRVLLDVLLLRGGRDALALQLVGRLLVDQELEGGLEQVAELEFLAELAEVPPGLDELDVRGVERADRNDGLPVVDVALDQVDAVFPGVEQLPLLVADEPVLLLLPQQKVVEETLADLPFLLEGEEDLLQLLHLVHLHDLVVGALVVAEGAEVPGHELPALPNGLLGFGEVPLPNVEDTGVELLVDARVHRVCEVLELAPLLQVERGLRPELDDFLLGVSPVRGLRVALLGLRQLALLDLFVDAFEHDRPLMLLVDRGQGELVVLGVQLVLPGLEEVDGRLLQPELLVELDQTVDQVPG